MRLSTLLAGAAVAIWSGSALAGQTTILDTTDDIAFQGSSPTGWFGGSDKGDVIGTNFDTSQIVVTESGLAGGGLAIDFKLATQFSGTDCFGDTCAYNADLFLRTPSAGYSATPFDYAITLGGQASNGGYATTGLYQAGTSLTSQDIWASRGGFIYGGEYIPADGSTPIGAVPTVLTSGALVTDATLTQSAVAGGYIDDISLDLTATQALPFLNGFDVLWGTGDCANDTVFGTVPEPAALAVFVMGLMGLGMIRRRDARPHRFESAAME